MSPTSPLRPGDLVEVRSPDEIRGTLDAEGALDHVPFMPEMVDLCGQRFRVLRRVVKTCFSGAGSYGAMRRFRGDDIVVLEAPRCSGQAHDGCQKGCMIFWREAWLRRVEGGDAATAVDSGGRQRLRASLKTRTGPTTYFCQASELLKATTHLSRREQLALSGAEIGAGNCGRLQMLGRLAIWFFWKIRRRLLGDYSAGPGSKTLEPLWLKPGDVVEVKPMAEIRATLNDAGHNRGLYFSPDLRLACGRQYRVADRLDRIITDGSGEMRYLRNTVSLEGSVCGCAHINVGGCSRFELVYWREDWLRRAP